MSNLGGQICSDAEACGSLAMRNYGFVDFKIQVSGKVCSAGVVFKSEAIFQQVVVVLEWSKDTFKLK